MFRVQPLPASQSMEEGYGLAIMFQPGSIPE